MLAVIYLLYLNEDCKEYIVLKNYLEKIQYTLVEVVSGSQIHEI